MSARVGWMADAACADRLDLPWVTDTANLRAMTVRAMRAVCDTCPVRDACDTYVHTSVVTGGTWAGIDRDTSPAGTRRDHPTPVAAVQDSLPGFDDLLGGVA